MADSTEGADSGALAAAPDGVAGPPEDVVAAVAADTAAPAADDTVVAAAEDTEEPPEDTRAASPPEDTAGGRVAAFVPKDWRKLNCPGGMAKVRSKIQVTLADGRKVSDWEVFCVDRYEAPGAGQSPTVDIDFAGARAACVSGGKRLCTRSEWRKSCGAKYPYGRTYDPDACNSVGSDGMPRPVLASGSKAKCKSGWGTYDMVGNVAEWTSDGTVNGGGAYKHGESGTCYQSSRRAGGHPYVGYRCCADAR
ncbi:MAG: hypothetical protein CVU56_28260 [Deltaproteobacteria bacterium HGW-Deltaproteobacteria-14]|nr:MAG: hypothetical protein CVU56_28260 [Deltaproteobacteria bacterium HGW-Deltaproteobacteria-14]